MLLRLGCMCVWVSGTLGKQDVIQVFIELTGGFRSHCSLDPRLHSCAPCGAERNAPRSHAIRMTGAWSFHMSSLLFALIRVVRVLRGHISLPLISR
jgi:hypothetical protein